MNIATTPNDKYKEILLLSKMLTEREIPHTLRPLFDGWQIRFPILVLKDYIASIIEHRYSYGLEIMSKEILGHDDVEGHFTAKKLCRLLEDYYNKNMKGKRIMTNYICINGKKAELTDEQLKALGIELPKANPFERVKLDKPFYRLGYDGAVYAENERGSSLTNNMFNVANYCTDKSLMEQRALHETLNRLLWRYSMEHNGDKLDWHNGNHPKYYIIFDHMEKVFDINYACVTQSFITHFYTEEIAQNAIEEIIKPFMEAHPEFVL